MKTSTKTGKHKSWNLRKGKFEVKETKERLGWQKIGVVGVDSGTLMITDPCYVIGDNWSDKDYDEEVCNKLTDHSLQVYHTLGHAGKAVLFSSGFGDGVYEVWARLAKFGDWGTRVAEVKIILIDEDDSQ